MMRCARGARVFYVEEPEYAADVLPRMQVSRREHGLSVATPLLPQGCSESEAHAYQRRMLSDLTKDLRQEYVLWYYTPMARPFSSHLNPVATVYDCMDELGAFKGAPPSIRERERELFACADLVFTGGQSLYEAKRNAHDNVHLFPSSVDVAHFRSARKRLQEPEDQAAIPGPRAGFYGVLDERLDVELLAELARLRPELQLVLVGPIVKITPEQLPQAPNIHYLGGKSYQDLPRYLAGWDVALLPFARNESTKFISPTKTPEYLAAGKPVVSTPITDVVRPYGELGLVQIAEDAAGFAQAIDVALTEQSPERLAQIDVALQHMSWDRTWGAMQHLIHEAVALRRSGVRALAPTGAAAKRMAS